VTTKLSYAQIEQLRKRGFCFPIDVLSESEADRLLLEFGRYGELVGRLGGLVAMNRYYPKPHLLAAWADRLAHNERILDAVESVIGPDILVWATQVFVRPAHDLATLAWHQDALYYGLEGFEDKAVRVWVALTKTSIANGTMSYVSGSHRQGLIEHSYTGNTKEEFMRGEEIQGDLDWQSAEPVILRAGQAAMHYLTTAHGSGSNITDQDRVNFAIDYLAPQVVPNGLEDSALLARGEDRFGHFALERRPRTDFDGEALESFYRATTLRLRRLMQVTREKRTAASST